MRRTFNNSTAIAVALAMVLPNAAAAQAKVFTAAEAAELSAQRAGNMPLLANALQMEIAGGVTADDLKCPMNAPKPCTTDFMFTPKGIAVQLAEDGTMFLAQSPVQTSTADEQGNLRPKPDAPLMQTMEAAPDKKAEKAAEKAERKAEKAADKAEKTAEKMADASSDDDLAAKLKAKADADAAAAQQAEADAAAAAEAAAAAADAQAQADATANAEADAAAAEQAKADAELAAKLAEAAEQPAEKPAEPAVAEAQPAEPVVPQPAEAAAATADTKAEMKADAKAEKAEMTAETKADTPAPAAAPAPAADTTSPDALAKALAEQGATPAPAKAAETTAPVAVPEAQAKQTEAAKQAAAETAAPTAAALSDTAKGDAQVTETKVTAENARSSDEDFAVKVGDALKAAAAATATGAQTGTTATAEPAQPAAEKKKDNNNDLAIIALGALAGMAAGQMLSNNRQVALNTGDRVIVTLPDGSQQVVKDDNALLLQPGSTVQTENFADGSSRTTVLREDGSRVVTIRDADLRVLRRTLIAADGTTTQLIDDTAQVEPVRVADLPAPAQPVSFDPARTLSETELRAALEREVATDRRFTLGQIRNIPEVRALVAPVDIQAITFDTGSAAIKPDQAQQLSTLGRTIADMIRANPREIFMIEGYTDTVGADAMNLALSDRRAESVALALTEYFQVPPENMVVQGYGEQFLRVPVEGDVRANRRASVRRITDLMAQN